MKQTKKKKKDTLCLFLVSIPNSKPTQNSTTIIFPSFEDVAATTVPYPFWPCLPLPTTLLHTAALLFSEGAKKQK